MVVETPVNWARLYQLYSNTTHRGQPLLTLVFFGVLVEARCPVELRVNTELALIDITRRQRPS